MPLSSADIFSFKILFAVASCPDKCLSFETCVFQDGRIAQADFAFTLLTPKLLFLTEVKNEIVRKHTDFFPHDEMFLKAARLEEVNASRI